MTVTVLLADLFGALIVGACALDERTKRSRRIRRADRARGRIDVATVHHLAEVQR